MSTNQLNFIGGMIGLFLLFFGLLLYSPNPNKCSIFSIPLTGVGGSILATVLTNWILNYRIEALPIATIIKAMSTNARFVRQKQRLLLEFTIEDNAVKLIKSHEFILSNTHGYEVSKHISIFTDCSYWKDKEMGGFINIIEPNGKELNGRELENYIVKKYGKIYFNKKYKFDQKSSNHFKFESMSFYRRIDRLIWTVQDFSEDFEVKILNKTNIFNAFKIKINHHNENDIMDEMYTSIQKYETIPTYRTEEIKFSFNSDILPFQGFEIMWNLEKKTNKFK